MPAYYTFLVSSLRMLNFFSKPPFSLEDFFAKCQNLILDKELEILLRACQQDTYSLGCQSPISLKKWAEFEIVLRNELARFRAARKKIDPLKFLRLPDSPQAQIQPCGDGRLSEHFNIGSRKDFGSSQVEFFGYFKFRPLF